jgi:DNA polymerase-3 subunit gamma/tau
MEKYVVSARKYRPDIFEKVVGQEHITQTLKNSIGQNKLAHAFLFCGPRGVGKTTCARILAKAINCNDLSDSCEPCGKCDSCDSFQRGGSLNIYELDAASNNHVDDIRRLIEQVRYAPQSGKYKTYIIDEVHMLSQAAFNAFLKTLEEPPEYAVFILATTEKQKIIPTILSRCQIFDFYRIEVNEIVEHLTDIAESEGVKFEKEALHLIAQKSDGGLRDALSVFDRIISFSNKEVSYQSVIENLNILDYDYFFQIMESIMLEDQSRILNLLEEILRKGFEGDDFIQGLSEHVRQLMVCKHPDTLQLLEVSDDLKNLYQKQSDQLSTSLLMSALDLLNQCDIQYKQVKNQRLHVEINLLKLCFIQSSIAHDTPIAMGAMDTKKKSRNTSPESLAQKTEQAQPVSQNKAPKEATVNDLPEVPIQESIALDDEALISEQSVEKLIKEPIKAAAVIPDKPDESLNLAEAELKDPKEVDVSENEVEPVSDAEVNKKRVIKGVPSFKLSDLDVTNDKKEVQEEEDKVSIKKDVELNQEDLTKAWKSYCEKCEKEGSSYLLSLLKNLKPKVHEYNLYKVVVGHKVEREKLLAQNRDIADFMGAALGEEVFMDIVVKERKKESSDLAYTNRDKFKRMLEKNPKLMDFKNGLDLEVDY